MVFLLELVAGLLVVCLTLRDVFGTVLVPGESRGPLRIVRRIVLGSLPLWRRAGVRGRGVSTSFAPFALVTSFTAWMLLLSLGFGMMTHALRLQFEPVLPSFPQALYVAGSGLATIGLSETDATGAARWVVMGAGFCGLAVMTMAVTYMLEVQGGIAARDADVLKTRLIAGDPPSGLALLERYGGLGLTQDVSELLTSGRAWCACVLQSHASHPSLIYFRSKDVGAGWPATLGALIDLALIFEWLLDTPQRGQGVLLREEGERLSRTLAHLIGLSLPEASPTGQDVMAVVARLRAAGYAVRDVPDLAGYANARARALAPVDALSIHLGVVPPPLVSPRSERAI